MALQLSEALKDFKLEKEAPKPKQQQKPKAKAFKPSKEQQEKRNAQTQQNQKGKKPKAGKKPFNKKKQVKKPVKVDVKLTDLKMENQYSNQRNQAEILFKSHNKIESIRRDLYLERKTVNGMMQAYRHKQLEITKGDDGVWSITYPYFDRKKQPQRATHKFDKPFSIAVWLTRRIELLQATIEFLESKKANRRKYQAFQQVLIDTLKNL